ncbi:MAG: nucleotidyltransferase domain-containing protein [bacterium]|nr:nucleotidyltransferase domain-containing protein [bacterium]
MVQNWYNLEYEIILHLLRGKAHVRVMSRDLKIPHSTLLRKLTELNKRLIIDYAIEGKNKVYSLKKILSAQKIIVNAENYKLIKLISKHPWLSPLFSDILKENPSNLIILFGSYAKDTEKKESDIDLFIETDNLEMKKKIESIHPKLSVKIGYFDPEALLIKEIIKNHIILKGAETYYERTKFFA